MPKQIVIIQGHPDPAGGHFCHALADAYAQAAELEGHTIRRVEVAQLDFPLLRTAEAYTQGPTPAPIIGVQHDIGWGEHLVIFYPLWLGTMPALLKAFFEQVFRPGFAVEPEDGKLWKKMLGGKSARVVITMGMPAFLYRWYYRAHSLKSLERNILRFCGIGPIKESLIGMVEVPDGARNVEWLDRMRRLGKKGA